MSTVPNVTLNDGTTIPQLGYGVWQVPKDEVTAAVTTALEAGYRGIDTAAIYGNEEGTGAAIAASGIPREDLHVTTKLWNSEQGYDSTLRAFDESMAKLGLDYLDLYLIHWAAPRQDKYVDTFKAFEKLRADGRVRSIGVSNFHVPHLERLLAETDVVPSVNQIELHPNLQQAELRAFHEKHGIATEAWSPLASGQLLKDKTIAAIGEKHGKSTAQVILRWHLDLGNIVIPKSVTPARIQANIDVFDFTLDDDDRKTLAALDNGTRTGPNPDTFEG
ncbi:oxidoreductase of aldo/keto reductase family, subgroup 1 [Actinokineospora spheciospongiae]|uniref:Oxidoreductase of aldo/keto reductase family, subgroup 1 n=1 Tax=Actinokineospora spheciospongiae TaxID=909613 RepID=W7J1H3_9PSEU|nr:aldo/keto reductase [Actinokineospora spheciospongiae]EWC59949.1 oxidoreductase of aldo/keto reductase family, subgroup 1 [Actinokineospora spheciospongiae]PWW52245.1 diketogulonate reductase-like aldo/keto reductase [Actinokineospora spheciospongiae]